MLSNVEVFNSFLTSDSTGTYFSIAKDATPGAASEFEIFVSLCIRSAELNIFVH